MDATLPTLADAATDLRKRLAGVSLQSSLLLMAPGVKQALPAIVSLLDQLPILVERVGTIEGALRRRGDLV